MQKVFISSKDSQYPYHASSCDFRKEIAYYKVMKIAELQAKLEKAVLDNQALRGRNKELNENLCSIKEQLNGEQTNKKMEKTAKGTLKHQRNRSQPDMEIENQLSNPTLKYSQPQKSDFYDMVKMERQEISIYEEKATRKLISSKNPAQYSSTITSTPTNKQILLTINHKGKVTKRRSDCGNIGSFPFQNVEQIWTSTKTIKQPSHKLSYLKK